MSKNTINNKSDPLGAANVTINSAYTLPDIDGTLDQALTTDGAGNIAWEDIEINDLTWNEITTDTTAVVNNAYICNAASVITVTMPATFTINDRIKIMGKNTGGWAVVAASGDTIYHLDDTKAAPATFSLVEARGCCDIQGLTANADWEVINVEGEVYIDPVLAIIATGSIVYSVFLNTSDGVAKSIGLNADGQLGDGTITARATPVSVTGGHSFTDIQAGRTTCSALKADGSVWAWGDSTSGQLGDGTTVKKSSPVAVTGGHSFIALFKGYNSSYALKSDDTAWAWGSNGIYELSDGTNVTKSSPVQVINL